MRNEKQLKNMIRQLLKQIKKLEGERDGLRKLIFSMSIDDTKLFIPVKTRVEIERMLRRVDSLGIDLDDEEERDDEDAWLDNIERKYQEGKSLIHANEGDYQ